jgi:hypothetical protein
VIGLLEAILCAIQQLAAAIIGLLVVMLNAALVALGAFMGVIIGLLPDMPEAPAKPNESVLGFLNWLFPLAGVAAILVTMGSLFLGFLAVRIALNWIRAL